MVPGFTSNTQDSSPHSLIFQESSKRPLVFEVPTHEVCLSPLLYTGTLIEGQEWLVRSVIFQLNVAMKNRSSSSNAVQGGH